MNQFFFTLAPSSLFFPLPLCYVASPPDTKPVHPFRIGKPSSPTFSGQKFQLNI
jgi:hypothetical protein